MKRVLKIATFISMLGVLVHLSCQKKFLCPDCDSNKPPIAHAGKDTTIILPVDSVILDGSASTDDKKIVSYQWTKISGPDTFKIVQPTVARTTVNKLVKGVFAFELKVTDAEGLFSKDTVQITVIAAGSTNHPPVACAGADRTITLPTDTVTLDGSCSTDPDNNITSYSWTKITGPSSFSIANANAVITQVSNLTVGIYQFELKVTDALGLFSKDTVQVTVDSSSSQALACGDSNRPTINAQLIPFGTLSEPRAGMVVASAGNKILFAGGGSTGTRVDIFDFAANTWSTAELNLGRHNMAAVGAGNKIFFAGGDDFGDVDIYDVTTNTWSLSRLLMQYGNSLAAAALGNKVFFAGGNKGDYPSSSVDIYDLTTNTWSTASLSAPRNYLTANSGNNKVYFTGGYAVQTSNVIDIYDNTTGVWSTSYLQVPRARHAAIAVNDVLYFAGGAYSDGQPTCSVETWNINTGARTLMYLSSPAPGFLKAVVINNKLLFFDDGGTTESRLDMYDIATNTWSIVVLPIPLEEASIISVNNTIYVAGGMVNGVLSNQVWKLEF